MSHECDICGFVNQEGSVVCALCGAPFPVAEHPHRVPSGVTFTTVEHDTDIGAHNFAEDTFQETEPEPAPAPTPRTDLGERAALQVAKRSGRFRAVSDSGVRAAPISDVGEAAIEAAVIHDAGSAPPPERLLGRVKLVVEQGLIIGEQYLLADTEIMIGRADQDTATYPDIDLGGQDNDYVHRVHARLWFHDLNTRLSVEHLGGVNPTLVNNQPVLAGELVELFLGDRLRVGRVVMRLAMA